MEVDPPMRRSSLLVPILGLLAATPAGAALIHAQGFNSAVGLTYTVTGGGSTGGGANYWARASTVDPTGFTGQEGADFWAGADLDDVPGAVHAIQLNDLSLAGYTGVTVSIWLAATTGQWDPLSPPAQPDVVRIIAINAVSGVQTVLDTFTAPAANTNLVSAANGQSLNTAFANFTYNVPVSIGTLRFRFEANSSGDAEWVGFDNVRIEGTPVPEPASAALVALGIALLAGVRRASLRQAARRGDTITLP